MIRQTSARYRLIVVAAFAAALVLRGLVGYRGGVWADEGSFLEVIAAPSWGVMIDFLRLHESHPPLFYLLMRAWELTFGRSDQSLMALPVILGAAIVPVVYVAGSRLFSPRVGVLAAVLSAFSGSLTEHTAQIRPYGLLSILVTASCASMIAMLTTRSGRARFIYIASTLLMLYTHNWGWVIAAGQFAAVAMSIVGVGGDRRRWAVRQMLISWAFVCLAYAPWFSTLLYQTVHAGHGTLGIEKPSEAFGFFAFSVYRIIETLALGRLGDRRISAAAMMIAAAASVWLVMNKFRSHSIADDTASPISSSRRLEFSAAKLLLHCVGFALLTAFLLSPFSNLLLPRCISTVLPPLLLCLSYWVTRSMETKRSLLQMQLSVLSLTIVLVSSMFELGGLMRTTRSNVREIAAVVRKNMQPGDLLIVAPIWFAGAFDHYFPPSIEQVNHPSSGRTGMIDFADVWESLQKSNALSKLDERLMNARRARRRVWFVAERQYLRTFSEEQLVRASRYHQPGVYSARDVKHIRAELESLYGPARMTFGTGNPAPIHDNHVAFLFVPPVVEKK